MSIKKAAFIVVAAISIVAFTGVAFSASNPDLSQTINSGTISTDILDSGRNSVGSPSFSLPAQNFSFDCQTSTASGASGFGTSSQRIYVMNPSDTANWSLTLAATSGNTATWSDGSNTFDFNDPNDSGCTDGGDADSIGGQLTVDASAGTLTTDCTVTSCNTTGISQGSSTGFDEGTTDDVTLLSASAAQTTWRGYLTQVTLDQTIPPETPGGGTYTINLTLTVASS